MAIAKSRPSLTGLTNALLPNTADPLGINVQRRGMDAYYADKAKSDPNYTSGPLPDPAWEGFFQAMTEQGVNRVGQDTARPEGLADDPEWAASGDAGALQQSGIPYQPLMKSNNLARPSMRGLQKAVR